MQLQSAAAICAAGEEPRTPNLTERLTLEELVYDWFLERYGTALAAEVHLTAFYTSLTRAAPDHRKIAMFARLLGVTQPLPAVRSLLPCLALAAVFFRANPWSCELRLCSA